MSADPAEQKSALRQQLRDAVKKISPTERMELSGRIRDLLIAQPVWQTARSILFFSAAVGEPDLWPLVQRALAAGQQVVLPSYSSETACYEGRLVAQPATDLQPGRFGILEPGAACPIFDLKQLDLALVPGIGFTLDGGRLGRGKGYYDRLLAEVSGIKCGVAFDCQVVDALPLEPHDVQLNCILTPTRWHSAVRPARS